MERASFGGGCFWGVEQLFREIPGVLDVRCGYMGGAVPNPSYEEVCTDCTGHAEVVRVFYDPGKVSYERLLDAFFQGHDPTTVNRQGPDKGTQYRSVIFVHDSAQDAAAKATIERLNKEGRFSAPIVTHVCPVMPFYEAEEYHQRYFEKNPNAACHIHR